MDFPKHSGLDSLDEAFMARRAELRRDFSNLRSFSFSLTTYFAFDVWTEKPQCFCGSLTHVAKGLGYSRLSFKATVFCPLQYSTQGGA